MFRKTALSALAVVVLATSAFSVSATTASAGSREGRFIAGAVIGVAAGLIGAGLYESGRRDRYERYDEGRDCFEKPVRRYDPYYGHKVTVGYRLVCR
ncbi:tyrosyl-tRNA synthetase [Ensifer soli]|uniref:tyrosyl-tRNA synthetase n=1 Tax=Ciceribacter sp. sgz301302 TaxID=3342379 RepID=UPI0035B6EC17